jgi:shikimate kinase|tara:strand:- start:312 stop:881 length:570 start_codon:yes stop_codon:yes gene_type:complete
LVDEGKKMILKKPIVLVGMMGSGKTAVGNALSKSLNVEHVDSDEEIVKAANMSIAEIFERDGEIFFRERESEILNRILDGKPKIISTGGGAFSTPLNRKLISQKGVSIWLNADINLLWSRIKNNKTRPLLNVTNPFEVLKKLNSDRKSIYDMATICVEICEDYTIAMTSNVIIKKLLNNSYLERETNDF